MPVTWELREDGRVSHYFFTDPWKATELTHWYPQDNAYRDSVKFRVHTVMDLRNMRQVPSGVLSVRNDAPAFRQDSGQLVMIGAATFAKVITETVLRLVHYDKAKFFDTAEEGWAYMLKILREEPSK